MLRISRNMISFSVVIIYRDFAVQCSAVQCNDRRADVATYRLNMKYKTKKYIFTQAKENLLGRFKVVLVSKLLYTH